ncbi:MAG: GtrA family protein [Chloroflexi bacterium]|nr:GtrA family protein [Chloroflexota bacterium]
MRQMNHDEQTPYSLFEKFGKFAIVGVSGVGVNSAVLYILYEQFHLPLIAASVLAVQTAIGSNFLLNSIWTFHGRSLSLHRFAKFDLVSLGGMIITVSTLQGLVSIIGLHYQAANLIGIALATLWNFGANLLWTWGGADRWS